MSQVRTYHGTRLVGGTVVAYDIANSAGVKYAGGPVVPPKPRGFDWGNTSEGARDLAVALIHNATGSAKLAESVADAFLRVHVSTWAGNWKITSDEILRWLSTLPPIDPDQSGSDLTMGFVVFSPVAKGGA